MPKIIRSNEFLRHKCILGYSLLNEGAIRNHENYILDRGKRLNDDCFTFVFYNFCPICGERLNVQWKESENGTTIMFFKS